MYKLTIKTIYETIELEIEDLEELKDILKLYEDVYVEMQMTRIKEKVKSIGGKNEGFN